MKLLSLSPQNLYLGTLGPPKTWPMQAAATKSCTAQLSCKHGHPWFILYTVIKTLLGWSG